MGLTVGSIGRRRAPPRDPEDVDAPPLRSGPWPGSLAKYVDAFVEGVSAELGELAGTDHRRDVVIDAGDLVAAVIDSDERRSVAELEAWLDDIGARLEPPVLVSSERLRESEMLSGKRTWLQRPSTLFDLLLRADERDGTARAARYYDHGIRLAHAAASVDLVPSPDEITAIDRYRNVLLAAFDAAGVPRPGQRRRERSAAGPAPAAAPLRGGAGAAAGAADRGAADRARRAGRSGAGQDRRAAAHQPAAHPAPARGAGAADAGDQPPPRVHRQPRHRQDDRRPVAQPDPARPGHRLQGPSGGDRPLGTSSPATSGRPPRAPAACWSRRSAARC